MGDRVQQFGGAHTRKKLDVVAQYLAAYVTVMKKQQFNLLYVDGFAGSGASTSKGDSNGSNGIDLFPADCVVDGSPVRALSIDPPFDHYVFIDKNRENVKSLAALREQYSNRRIEPVPGDANDALGEVCKRLEVHRLNRAVVFLDPFGLSVQWSTIRQLAATKKVDLWYLVPVDGMSRQIKDDGSFLPGAARIDAIWGSDDWRGRAVQRRSSGDLFGGIDERVEKIARAKQFSDMFREHLAEVFEGGVSKHYLPLGRGKRHDFSLMFACANPSRPASGTAMRIAEHILRTA